MPRGGWTGGKRAVDLTEEEIRRVYVETDLGIHAACKVIQCSAKILIQAMRMYGIPSKPMGKIGAGRPPIHSHLADHGWLKEQIETRTFKSIAKELGVSESVVRGYVIRHGLYEKYATVSEGHKAGARKAERETKYDKITSEDIHRVYLATDATILQACEALQCSLPTLTKAMRELGIPGKSHGRLNRKWTPNSKDFPQLLDEQWLRGKMEQASYRAIAKEIGTTPWNVKFHAHRLGLSMNPLRMNGSSDMTPEHPNRLRGPYVQVYCPTHPDASEDGYVAEHRLVLEKKLGRYLFPDEHCHHKDDNKRNNDPDNLEALTRAEHARKHYGEHAKSAKMLKAALQKIDAQATELTALKAAQQRTTRKVERLIVDNELRMFEEDASSATRAHALSSLGNPRAHEPGSGEDLI